MKGETASRVARASTTADIQKWSSGIGKFYTRLHPQVMAEVRNTCGVCPFRNNRAAGGCLTDGCPVHQVQHLMQRVLPRTAEATKEIYKAKYSQKTA